MSDDDRADFEAALAAMRASRRRALRFSLALGALLVVVTPVWQAEGENVRRYVRGEIDLEGEPRFEPPHEPDARALSEIDFALVHERLLPSWSIALANASSPYWERQADRSFERLAAEVAPDPNLHELLSTVHARLREDPVAHAPRLDYFLWAYNDYLDQQRVPYRVEASLVLGGERPVFRTLSYEVLADGRNPQGHRLRLVRRADRTSLLEGWMGKAGRGDDGAMVLMRRVLHFAVRHVWPALHPAIDARRPPAERSWLPFVREEIEAQLAPETFRLLAETAVDQQALVEVERSVAARETCGSQFRIYSLPYNGLSRRDVRALEVAAYRSQFHPECPDITLDEAARIIGASERLSTTEGLEVAVETLAMVVARAVGTHELRHVADGDDLACPGCPDGLEGIARDEVSAYLSAFADPALGYLSLFQACATPRGNGVHGAALDAVIEAVLPFGCEGPPLFGLQDVAGRIEKNLFGARPRVALPALPARVQLLPRRARAALHR